MSDERGETVQACPECQLAGGLRYHTESGAPYARDPSAYRRTDYTCKECGSYLTRDELITRPPKGPTRGQRTQAAKILEREDVTTWQAARRAFQEDEPA